MNDVLTNAIGSLLISNYKSVIKIIVLAQAVNLVYIELMCNIHNKTVHECTTLSKNEFLDMFLDVDNKSKLLAFKINNMEAELVKKIILASTYSLYGDQHDRT